MKGVILSLPVHATTQNSARLGPLCSELSIPSAVRIHDKTAFSMCVPALMSALPPASSVAIVGIESHICVTQTTLDLLKQGHKVYVLADGVSSCNKEEIPIALRRLAKEGAIITTSESWLYEVMGDAGIAEFKGIAGLVKEEKEGTKASLENLCKM